MKSGQVPCVKMGARHPLTPPPASAIVRTCGGLPFTCTHTHNMYTHTHTHTHTHSTIMLIIYYSVNTDKQWFVDTGIMHGDHAVPEN